ncbi:hypothetical protein IWQ57_005836, partial [Coemansia nantahalensis]
MADHRASPVGKEAELELELELERLVQLEMGLGTRETQMAEQATEPTAAHRKAIAERTAAQQDKDEKRISELVALLGQGAGDAGAGGRSPGGPG